MPFKVKVDRTLCIGAATCVVVSPQQFELDSEGKSTIKKKDGTTSTDWVKSSEMNGTQDELEFAAKSCPVDAIVIIEVDSEGKELRQIWPKK